MKPFSGLFVSSMRLFWGGMTSKVNHLFVKGNLSLIGFGFQPFFINNTLKAMLVGCNTVGPVLTKRRQSEIGKPIVRLNPIDVINLIERPLSGHVEPRKAMGGKMSSVNFKTDVSAMMHITRNPTNADSRPWFRPSEYPCFGVVIEHIKKILVIDVPHKSACIIFYPNRKGLSL
jgi:hypothetical protein